MSEISCCSQTPKTHLKPWLRKRPELNWGFITYLLLCRTVAYCKMKVFLSLAWLRSENTWTCSSERLIHRIWNFDILTHVNCTVSGFAWFYTNRKDTLVMIQYNCLNDPTTFYQTRIWQVGWRMTDREFDWLFVMAECCFLKNNVFVITLKLHTPNLQQGFILFLMKFTWESYLGSVFL